LVQRFCEISVTRLQFREEPSILDRDDRLVGGGLQEHHLPLAEELNLRSAELDAADGDTVSQQRNAEDRAEAEPPRVLDGVWTSRGESEITRRISAEAVCCSEASASERLSCSFSACRSA
jgi:hypothetical protein